MKRKGKTSKLAARGRLGLPNVQRRTRPSKAKQGDVLDVQEKEIDKFRSKAAAEQQEKDLAKQPHTLVIHRGKVGKYVKALEMDLRGIMEPNTAKNLKVRKNNNIKDFIVNGSVLGVTNMMVLTASDKSLQLRMMRFSQGPTLTFRVDQYSISRHVISAQRRPFVYQKLYKRPPLVVMNGFQNAEKQVKLVQTYIQNMFPTLNIDTVDLRDVKRCLMVNYNPEDDTIDIRHYALRVVASGMNKSCKKLLNAQKSSTKSVPDLSKYKDISEYFLNPGQLSDSEFEGEQAEVELGQNINERSGCVRGEKSNVRLMELGPRLSLQLIKIQEGIDEGEVLYHKLVSKSTDEIMGIRKEAPMKKKLKKHHETAEQQRVIRRLTNIQEKREREEAEVRAIMEKAARKQAAATGQTEDIETDRMKDREIAMNREREMKAAEDEKQQKGQKRKGNAKSSAPLDYTRKKKKNSQ